MACRDGWVEYNDGGGHVKTHTVARWKISISQRRLICCEMEIFHLAILQLLGCVARWKISISQHILICCEMEIFHLATVWFLSHFRHHRHTSPAPHFIPFPGTSIRARTYLDIIWPITRARVSPATPTTQPATTGHPLPHHHHTPPVPQTLPMHPPAGSTMYRMRWLRSCEWPDYQRHDSTTARKHRRAANK